MTVSKSNGKQTKINLTQMKYFTYARELSVILEGPKFNHGIYYQIFKAIIFDLFKNRLLTKFEILA
jgi:hypothetical protein